jgi:hypothetical protein
VRTKLSSLAIIAVLGLGLSACGETVQNFQDQLNDFNPMGQKKTKLPGERRAMFPEGVPGVQQGVPAELMKGAPKEPEVETVATPAPAAKPKTRRVRTASPAPRQAARRQAAPQAEAPAAAPQAAPAARAPASAGNWGPPPSSGAAPTAAWPDPPKAQ